MFEIIAKVFKGTMERVIGQNWTNLYPEAEEVIFYVPTGIDVRNVPGILHSRGVEMHSIVYTPRNAKNSNQKAYISKKSHLEHSLTRKKMTMVEDDDWKEVWVNGGTTKTVLGSEFFIKSRRDWVN